MVGRHVVESFLASMLIGGAIAGCAPDLDDRLSIVEAPTLAAIRPWPAEAPPGTSATYTALYIGPHGVLDPSPLDWAFCTLRKPLAILAPVHPDCIEQAEGHGLIPLGTGFEVTGTVPADACRTFGPEVPDTDPDQPPGRGVDPDGTGGYHQPVVLQAPGAAEDVFAVGFTRLRCGLAGGTEAQTREYNERYRNNANPRLTALSLVRDAGAREVPPADGVDSTIPVVASGERVTLRAAWPECPGALDDLPVEGCGGSEPFLYFDQVDRQLVERREAMRIAWYATGGEYDEDRTGRESGDTETSSDNGWTAPMVPGVVDLWVVIRDERGGVGWQHYQLRVESIPPP